jgi:hypothetical protein
MSIVTTFFADLFGKNKVSFDTAVQKAAASIDKWVAGSPTAQAVASDVLSATKQGVSTALSLADTELGPDIQVALTTITGAIDGLLQSALKPIGPGGQAVAAAATPMTNMAISQLFQVVTAAVNHMEVEAKAWTSTPS